MNFGNFCQAIFAAVLVLPRLDAHAAGTATVRGENTLIRSEPTRFSPSIAKLQPGEVITVLEEITLEKPAAGDELRWLKIVCPTNATAWVNGLFLDTNRNAVTSPRLNVRAGASENHPVIGRLERGQAITNLSVKGDWVQIIPPPGAYAFVAVSLVNLPQKPESEVPATGTNVVAVIPVAPITNEVTTITNSPVAAQPVDAAPATNVVAAATPVVPEPAPAVAAPVTPEPPKPRIVTREGRVSSLTSIQAPSFFKLEHLQTRRIMDYLVSASTNLGLSYYVGQRVIVTGEETLDRRWTTTPVITVQRIQVVEE